MQPKQVRKLSQVKNDDDLKKQERNNDYRRRQALLDTFNVITRIAIFSIPAIIIILFTILVFHALRIGDYETLKSFLFAIVSAAIGYLAAYLQKNGLGSNTE